MAMLEAERWNSFNSILSISFNWRPFGFHLMFRIVANSQLPCGITSTAAELKCFALNIWFDSLNLCAWNLTLKFLIPKLWSGIALSILYFMIFLRWFHISSSLRVIEVPVNTWTLSQSARISIDPIRWNPKLYMQNSMPQWKSFLCIGFPIVIQISFMLQFVFSPFSSSLK